MYGAMSPAPDSATVPPEPLALPGTSCLLNLNQPVAWSSGIGPAERLDLAASTADLRVAPGAARGRTGQGYPVEFR